MPHSIFGWDLPPGCRVSDIPGNRPEDEAWEGIVENFFDKKRFAKQKYGLKVSGKEHRAISNLFRAKKYDKVVDAVEIYIEVAIEYGMQIGEEERKAAREENKYYDRLAVERAFEDSKTIEEAQEKVLVYLGLKPKESK